MEDTSDKGEPHPPRRKFIRHTAGVPLEVSSVDGDAAQALESVNVSVGGLSFVSEAELPVGSVVRIRIPTVDPPFDAGARVVWTSPEHGRHCIGVQFLSEGDAFRARMVEQVCAIDQYRCDVQANEGRVLSAKEAAAEWITRYAGRFPHA